MLLLLSISTSVLFNKLSWFRFRFINQSLEAASSSWDNAGFCFFFFGYLMTI